MKQLSRILAGGTLAAAASFFAIQSASAQVFWSSNGNQDIMRAALDGTIDSTPFFQGDGLLTAGGFIPGLTATSTHLYWVENSSTGGVWRAPLDGSTAAERFITPPVGGLQFVAVDVSSNQIYFSDWETGLYSANLTTGGGVTNIGNPGLTTDALGRNTGLTLVGPNQLLSVAANAGDRNVYSTDIAAQTNSILGQYGATQNQSYGITYASGSNTAYVTTLNGNNLSAFDLSTNTSTVVATGINRALGAAIHPDQSQVFIVSQTHANNPDNAGIWVYDIDSGVASRWLDVDAGFGVAVIPEPGTYALFFGLAVGALLLVRRRFRK